MTLPDALKTALQDELDGSIDHCAAVSGGSIANACRIEIDDRPFFLKWGDDSVARTFSGEASGLKVLHDADHALTVPSVVAVDASSDERPGFLVMEWINAGRKGRRFWEDFGTGLAELHRTTGDRYGFDTDNFIGRLPQSNTPHDTWPDFFRAERLEPQVAMAREDGKWRGAWDDALDTLYRRLPGILPETPPASVVHGDLWNGNFMVTAVGAPALVDPAAYYGHREVDLAMSELFGGFESPFYEAYRATWALQAGYEERRDVYNLYHLINHLNHFGSGYANSVDSILKAFR